MPITPEELTAMRGRAETATPGPWKWRIKKELQHEDGAYFLGDLSHMKNHYSGLTVLEVIKNKYGNPEIVCWNRTDAEFISHARTDMPRLSDEVERLQKENEVMRINLMSIQGFCQGPDNRKRASLYFYGLETLDYLGSLASIALGEEENNG